MVIGGHLCLGGAALLEKSSSPISSAIDSHGLRCTPFDTAHRAASAEVQAGGVLAVLAVLGSSLQAGLRLVMVSWQSID